MRLKCPNCGKEFEPSEQIGPEYGKIAASYPCPNCNTPVRNPPVTGN